MKNPFENRSPSLDGPATDILPVTPDDAIDLPAVAIALYVETGGNLSFVSAQGQTRTLRIDDFTFLPVGARRVRSTGTTAQGLHALVVG